MRQLLRICISAALLAMSACDQATRQAVPQFQNYQAAFRAQQAVGTRVFDRLAEGERRLIARTNAVGSGSAFDPDLATSYLGVGEPPRTALLRGALDTVAAYNAALARLAAGDSGSQMASGIASVVDNLSATGLLIAGRPSAAVAGFDALAKALSRALPLLANLRSARDQRDFAKRLIAAAPAMRATIRGLRAATPAMFLALRESRATPGDLAHAAGLSDAARAEIDRDRRLLAGWVLLLDRTLMAMDAAVAAASAGGDPDHFAALIEASLRLRAMAEAIRLRGVN